MIKIAVCDDEYIFAEKIKTILITYMEARKMDYQVDIFKSGTEFLALGYDICDYNIAFLDINMEGLDGLKTAENIRLYTRNMFLVFVTAYINYSLDGYKYGAVRYILKDSKQIDLSIYECLDAILEQMNYVLTRKRLRFIGGERELYLNQIIYIESNKHKLDFYVKEDKVRKYTMYSTLNDFEKELDDCNFVRIHQSFMVNMKYVSEIEKYQVTLMDGKCLVIPKARYREVEDAFIAYRGEI
ncbi:MAG: LytTR family DNA-binding domain-containing protein [Eubacteriales bacterium]|nr:LytTR family DNA-binding domain-containing protein [Eubacteriales bacterium]